MRDFFALAARRFSTAAGAPAAFILAVVAVLLWLATGPMFGFSATWQLVVNTGTTIVTFLMVFLIQNAQNHDQAALQLKLDELLKAVTGARTGLVNLEDLSEEEIDALREQFKRLAEKHEDELPLVTAATDGRSK